MKTTIFTNFTRHHPTIFFSLPYDFNIWKQKTKKKVLLWTEQRTEWSKWCDTVTNTNSTLNRTTDNWSPEPQGYMHNNKNQTLKQEFNQNNNLNRKKRLWTECRDKHSGWRARFSRGFNTETNKKVLVKVGQASLTVWQGQQLHYLNKEHDVNLKWPQHNTAQHGTVNKGQCVDLCIGAVK